MKIFKTTAGTIAILTAIVTLPFGVLAANNSSFHSDTSIGVLMNADGVIKVVGAKVTSVSDKTINATVKFGNSELDFSVVTDSDTKFNGKAENRPDIDALQTGDRISFSGPITASTSGLITVHANHVVSKVFLNSLSGRTAFTGKVKSVDVNDNSFMLEIKDRTLEVKTTASTTITIDGVIRTLSFIEQDDKVKIEGSINPALTIITATKITVNDDNDDEDRDDNNNENEGKKKGWLRGLGNLFKKDK